MSRRPNQKLKLLYLMELLLEKTDETHPMTVPEMIDALAACGVSAERKSIYDDLEALRTFGLDIVQTRTRTIAYYVGARDPELSELKLLADCVRSCRFITEKKAISLIRKIESLTSAHDAPLLRRPLIVCGRIATMNDCCFDSMDIISDAIARDRAVRFKYFAWGVSRQLRFRRTGVVCEVSPFALQCSGAYLYLLAWDALAARFKPYRLDKLEELTVLDAPRTGGETFAALDPGLLFTHAFGAGGEKRSVTMRFANSLAGAVIDRFGKDTPILSSEDTRFTIRVTVTADAAFLSWLLSLGADAEVLAPSQLRRELHSRAVALAAQYADPKRSN